MRTGTESWEVATKEAFKDKSDSLILELGKSSSEEGKGLAQGDTAC